MSYEFLELKYKVMCSFEHRLLNQTCSPKKNFNILYYIYFQIEPLFGLLGPFKTCDLIVYRVQYEFPNLK